MKQIILILLLFPIICFSQKENKTKLSPAKPSSTDCPTWDDKGKKSNKSDYYRSLRSMKPMKNPDTSKNNYANSKPRSSIKKTQHSDSTASQKGNIDNTTAEKTKIKKDTLNFTKAVDTETKEKSSKEEEKNKKKTKRLSARKNKKARKHNSTDCPNF